MHKIGQTNVRQTVCLLATWKTVFVTKVVRASCSECLYIYNLYFPTWRTMITFHFHLYFSKRYKFIKWLWRTRVGILCSRLWRTRVLHRHLVNSYLLEKYKWKWNVFISLPSAAKHTLTNKSFNQYGDSLSNGFRWKRYIDLAFWPSGVKVQAQ